MTVFSAPKRLWCLVGMVGRIVVPQNVHVLIFGTCDYVRLDGKGELKLLLSCPSEGKMILDFSGGPNETTRGHMRGRGKQRIRVRERFEHGKRPQAKERVQFLEAGKEEMDSPPEPPERHAALLTRRF